MKNKQTASAYDMMNTIRDAVSNDFESLENFSGIEIDTDEDMSDALDVIDVNIDALSNETLSELYNAVLNDDLKSINWNAYRN